MVRKRKRNENCQTIFKVKISKSKSPRNSKNTKWTGKANQQDKRAQWKIDEATVGTGLKTQKKEKDKNRMKVTQSEEVNPNIKQVSHKQTCIVYVIGYD